MAAKRGHLVPTGGTNRYKMTAIIFVSRRVLSPLFINSINTENNKYFQHEKTVVNIWLEYVQYVILIGTRYLFILLHFAILIFDLVFKIILKTLLLYFF